MSDDSLSREEIAIALSVDLAVQTQSGPMALSARRDQHGTRCCGCVPGDLYRCEQCQRVCCWCFGGSDDPRCDDCVVLETVEATS